MNFKTPKLNELKLIGEFRGTPRVSETKSGTLMCRRTISVARSWTNDGGAYCEEFDDFETVSWGKVAEIVQKIESGSLVLIMGKVKLEQWYDDEDVQKTAMRIACDCVQFLCS